METIEDILLTLSICSATIIGFFLYTVPRINRQQIRKGEQPPADEGYTQFLRRHIRVVGFSWVLLLIVTIAVALDNAS